MSLGKPKEREEPGKESDDSHGATLFVSNLPYPATSVDLQTLFSDIAPVRSAFVVTEQGTGISKGVGYVSFAMKEDAEAVYNQVQKEALLLAGRKLRVDWADSKYKVKDPSEKKETKPRPEAHHHAVPRGPHDPTAIRTIVISGLPKAIDSNQLWKKIRKYKSAEKVEWPLKLENGTEDPSLAHALFTTPAAASEAVNKLHAHVYKGSLLSVTLKKRMENLSKTTSKQKDKGKDGEKTSFAPSHGSRLIVRNLPWNITEQDLRAIFLPYGPIHSIHIPTAAPPTKTEEEGGKDTSKPEPKPRAKGFAFVWMLSKKDAEMAIEGSNGKKVRAGTAQELVSDKQKRKKQKRLEKKLKSAEKVKKEEGDEEKEEEEEKEKEDEAEEEAEGGDEDDAAKAAAEERIIAVDWALSKDKWQEEKAKIEQKLAEDVEMADGSKGNDGIDSEDESEGGEDNIGVHSEDSDEGSGASDDEDDREEPVKPQLPAPEVGTTLFVRNVPFNATEDELRTLFRAYGPLRYARITMDPETGRSRGTGFACFWNIEDADKVVEQSDLLRQLTTGNTPTAVKKNPFVLPSILTADPSSSLAQSLVLHGRTLDAVRAVTRDQATKLRDDGERARQKADKRNMYLLKEGVILPNSPLAQDLIPAEVERRTNSFNARRALLKSNPSLFISRTRLSVRQIPTFVTERVLKRLALHAVRAFKDEVKAGSRKDLTPDELADPKPAPEEKYAEEEKTGKRFTGRATGVKQAKIVRQQERVDPLTGKGRSKGYGFIEMHKHSDALRVLRWTNCNISIGPLLEEWYQDEIKDLLKAEKAKDVKERDDAKINRMKEEIENGPSKKGGRVNLIVEFSIENVQVVQRRSAKQSETTSTRDSTNTNTNPTPEHKKRKARSKSPEKSEKTEEKSPKKKRRVSESKPKAESKLKDNAKSKPKEKKDASQSLGSIIGRKRKERKSGKKSG